MEEKYIITNCPLLGRSDICNRLNLKLCVDIDKGNCLCKEIYEWGLKNNQETAKQFEVIKESEIIEVW